MTEQALDRLTRAGDAISAAGTPSGSLGDAQSARALSESLADAAGLAEDAQRRAARVSELPEEVARRLRELEGAIETLTADLGRVRAEFETAASSYAPSSWREIGGVGQAATQDLERARRLHDSAARVAESGEPDRLERAEHELREASLAVADAARLRQAIEEHLEKLEAAAVEGRAIVLRAEQEIDRAWASVH